MNIKHYWNLMTGKIKVSKKASINFQNIKAVFQSFHRKHMIDGFAISTHIYEQILWRRTQVIQKSPQCWEQGYCKVCGCEISGKTMEDRQCESDTPCYPTMMSKEEWKKYKKDNNIKLFD